jgi:5-enolpyruvylshikimate-3-phosphate synthase
VAAAAASGKTRIRGAAELRHKESDRLSVMAAALHTLGIDVIEYSDGLEIMGGALGGGRVDSCGDHRVAMSLAIASVAARSPIEILHTSQVATSFPAFEATAAGAGIRVNVVPGNGP